MAKIELDNIGTDSFQSIGRYNSNAEKIEAAFENTLSRDGTGPNAMGANLDMNSNRIINLPEPTNNSEAATKEYVDDQVQGLVLGALPPSTDYIAADAALEASLTDQLNLVITDLNAEATRITTLEAQYDGIVDETTGIEAVITGLVSTETAARASADSALASRLDVVEASVESPNTLLVARVEDLETAVVDLETNTATASSVTTLTSRVDDAEDAIDAAEALITSESTTRATADSALSTRLDSVEASLGTPSTEFVARVETLEDAVVDLNAGKASASSVTTLTSTVNSLSSTVSTQASTIAGVDGKLSASYALTVDGNGRISQMKLLSNGSTSTVAFTADSFKIYNGTSNQSVFTVSGGSVKINGNLVVNGTLTRGSLASGEGAGILADNYYEQSGDPGAVPNGSLWFKTDTNELYIRRSGAWGKIANISTAGLQFTGVNLSTYDVTGLTTGGSGYSTTITATPVGGSGGFTYQWLLLSNTGTGTITPNVGTSSAPVFSLGAGLTSNAVFMVTATETGTGSKQQAIVRFNIGTL